jgi:hypothetical protein
MDSDYSGDYSYSYSDVSRVSIFSEIDTENGEYTNYNTNYVTKDNETDNDKDNDTNYDVDINRIRDMYDRNSLYTEPRRNTYIDENYEDDDNENDDLYSIMDFYTQPYTEFDNKTIEPVMQLPLSSNQLILMKRKWDKQLDMDLTKTLPKQTSSWPRFSVSSRSSNEYPKVPRNSHFSQFSNKSEKSEKSTKSSKSWKSFFSKFTKKSKKPQIKFYDNLVKR